VDGLQAIGDSISKLSTNFMKYGYDVVIYMPILQFRIYVTMNSCVLMGNFL
jgi:hypothetical protein